MIEGMACRLPIVIPRLDSVSHLYSHNNARPFSNFDANEIKSCFEYILENPGRRMKMGKNSEKAVLEEYNYGRRTEKLMQIYETCFNDN
jgi:glycosyltransferase involved in cell wall biosynthesis